MYFNLNTYLNLLSLVAMAVVAFYVVRSKVKDENLRDLKERVDILEHKLEDAHKQHVENQKAISNLEGQLQTYKEIPLKQIANSLTELSASNGQILAVLQSSAAISAEKDLKSQKIDTQTAEH